MIFKGRTYAEEKRLKDTTQTGLVSMEDGLDAALYVEEETLLEQALKVDIGASFAMPTGKIQDILSPPMTQKGVQRSQFRKAFEYSEEVEFNGMLGVGFLRL